MALYPFSDFVTTIKNKWALRVKSLADNTGQDYFVKTKTGTLESGENYDVFDTREPVVIDLVDWYARHDRDVGIRIDIRGSDSTQNIINRTGVGLTALITPFDVVNGLSIYFNVVEYDEEASPSPIFRFHLKNKLYCPQGVRIAIENTSQDEGIINSCQVRGRFM